MLSAEQNDLIARTNPGTRAGALLRRYWQPAALVDELSGNRPNKPVRLTRDKNNRPLITTELVARPLPPRS